MPAPQRSQEVELETMQSWDTANPTLGADLEGWLNYNTTTNRWNYWDGSNWIPLALDANNAVTNANLRDSAALSVIGRSANSVGDPADIATTSGANTILRESGGVVIWGKVGSATISAGAVDTAALADDNVTLAKIADMGGGGPGVLAADVSGHPEWKGPTNYPAYLMAKDAASSVSWPKISGTSFPTSPVDGQIFTHTTHRCMYYYDSAAAGWLSTTVYEFFFSATVDIAVSVYMAMGMSGTTQFTDTLGPRYGFATKVVGMSLQMGASGTGAVDVWDDGAVVGSSSAQLSLSAQQGKDDDTLMSTTIAAGSIIGVKRTSGTIEGPCLGSVRLRRFEA